MTKKIIIIGAGNMGFAIAQGLKNKNIYNKESIVFIETNKGRSKQIKSKGFKVLSGFNELGKAIHSFKNIEAIIIAIKPKDIKSVIGEITKYIPQDTLIISIAAGIEIKTLSFLTGSKYPIARVMPNILCEQNEGISAVSKNNKVTSKHSKTLKKIFESLGKCISMKEKYFDLVTAVSGSGPAYFCYLIECLTEGAVKSGLNKNDAYQLVLQTGLGTCTMLLKSNIKPDELRSRVTSPKGTTDAAINIFKKMNLRNIILTALHSAKKRSLELGKKARAETK